jgi:hypothetical protein
VTELITVAAALTATLTFPNETRRALLLLQLHLLLLYIKIKLKLLRLKLLHFTPRDLRKKCILALTVLSYEATCDKITEALSRR